MIKDLNPVTGLIAINNFFVKLENMRVEYVKDTYNIAKDPDKYSPYAYGAYGAGQYIQDKADGNLRKPASEKELEEILSK